MKNQRMSKWFVIILLIIFLGSTILSSIAMLL